jgi:hypothetical protein
LERDKRNRNDLKEIREGLQNPGITIDDQPVDEKEAARIII